MSPLAERAIEAAVSVALAVLKAVLGRGPREAEVDELRKRLEFRARAQAQLEARRGK